MILNSDCHIVIVAGQGNCGCILVLVTDQLREYWSHRSYIASFPTFVPVISKLSPGRNKSGYQYYSEYWIESADSIGFLAVSVHFEGFVFSVLFVSASFDTNRIVYTIEYLLRRSTGSNCPPITSIHNLCHFSDNKRHWPERKRMWNLNIPTFSSLCINGSKDMHILMKSCWCKEWCML